MAPAMPQDSGKTDAAPGERVHGVTSRMRPTLDPHDGVPVLSTSRVAGERFTRRKKIVPLPPDAGATAGPATRSEERRTPAARRPPPGSCGQPCACAEGGSTRASGGKPVRCWHRSMAGAPRGLTRPTCRRPTHYETLWRDKTVCTTHRCTRSPNSVTPDITQDGPLCTSCRTLPVAYAMMAVPMDMEAEYQAGRTRGGLCGGGGSSDCPPAPAGPPDVSDPPVAVAAR